MFWTSLYLLLISLIFCKLKEPELFSDSGIEYLVVILTSLFEGAILSLIEEVDERFRFFPDISSISFILFIS